jgi:hypothetical protein
MIVIACEEINQLSVQNFDWENNIMFNGCVYSGRWVKKLVDLTLCVVVVVVLQCKQLNSGEREELTDYPAVNSTHISRSKQDGDFWYWRYIDSQRYK